MGLLFDGQEKESYNVRKEKRKEQCALGAVKSHPLSLVALLQSLSRLNWKLMGHLDLFFSTAPKTNTHTHTHTRPSFIQTV
jgi:hypothetical protein